MLSVVGKVLFFASLAYGIPADFKLPELKEGGKHWALLVAGSSGWFNYRHQADVCHAYHILHSHGIPDERIVVMMVDDIAYNKENPTPGIIINHPKGKDVYAGVPKDYTGLKEVSPEVFLNVLQGDEEKLKELEKKLGHKIGSGKVIKSGENDNVFVNFVDHGAPGFVAFGSKMLHATALNKAIEKMHKRKQYNKMLLYIEACESGSMFKTILKKNLNVLAITAANSTQSSYACYFDKERKTYLGDLFSVNWMEDSDKEDLRTETIKKQYGIVKDETNRSQVMEFGDLKMLSMTVSQFQGGKQAEKKPGFVFHYDPNLDAVPSEDVEMEVYKNVRNMAKTDEERIDAENKLFRVTKHRELIDGILKKIVSTLTNDVSKSYRTMMAEVEVTQFDCYQPVVEHLQQTCKELELPFNGYALKQLRVIVALCEGPTQFSPSSIMEAINKTCDQ